MALFPAHQAKIGMKGDQTNTDFAEIWKMNFFWHAS